MHELKWEGVSGMHSATTLGEHTSPKRHDKERQHNPRYAPAPTPCLQPSSTMPTTKPPPAS